MAQAYHSRRRHSRQARPLMRRRPRHVSQRHAHAGWRERARVVASLMAAEQALPADPDGAALLLDGALSAMLDLWAQHAHIPQLDRRPLLAALDDQAPDIAARIRLALQAHRPEARLAHCWALLNLLTAPAASHTCTTLAPLGAFDRNARR